MTRKAWLLCIPLILISCLKKEENSFRVPEREIQNLTSEGCLNQYAQNVDPLANLENSSCTFNYCDQYGHQGYDQAIHAAVTEYIQYHGDEFQGQPRVTRTCGEKLIYCEHPDSLNYVPGPYPPFGYFGEYCKFKACDKYRYEGYKKFLEFTEYLKTYPGEIIIDNSQTVCGRKLIHDKVYKTTPQADPAAYDKAEISFTIDDSGSMQNEIDDVKAALVNLAPAFKNLGAATKLSFTRMSDIKKNPLKMNSIGGGFFNWRYQYPASIGDVNINANSNVTNIRNDIMNVLDDFNITGNFGSEQGLCLSLMHLNDRIAKSFDPKTRYINIVITDEDEHNQNNSTNCTNTFEAKNGPSNIRNTAPFKDMNNNALHIEGFNYMIMNQVLPKERDAYGWIGLFYDRDNSNCSGAEQHGETYLDFVESLKTYQVPYEVGDICANDYTQLIYDKLINGFLNKVSLKYLYHESVNPPLSVNAVYLVDQNDQPIAIDSGKYTLSSENGKHYLTFEESLKDTVFNAKEIRINFTYGI